MQMIKASNYVPSKEQIKWYLFCVNNNIRISLNGIYNQPKKYRILTLAFQQVIITGFFIFLIIIEIFKIKLIIYIKN